MSSTVVVLATGLILGVGRFLLSFGALVATVWLAKREGLELKSVSYSYVHGFSSEFVRSEPN